MDKPKPLSVEFLLKRGYCCGSGCQNCPYEPKHERLTTSIQEQYQKPPYKNLK